MFLNPLMLAGIGGAAVPLVLHLLNRARYRTVDWGGMMFLGGQSPRQQRRSRMRQLPLLIVRMALVATLAVALARPIVHGPWALSDTARTTAVIVFDRSASMGYDENGQSRLDLARQAAMHILTSLRGGDQVALLLTGAPGDPPTAQPTADLQAIAARLVDLKPSFGQADLATSLQHAAQILDRHPHDNHELFVITDRQALNWAGIDDTFAAGWTSRRVDGRITRRFVVIPVGTDSADNLAIEAITPQISPAVVGLPTEIEIRIRNHGPTARAAVPLTLTHGQRTLLETSFDIPPQSTHTLKADVHFDRPGEQVLTATLHADGLVADNTLDAVVVVLPKMRVLLVSGDQREGAFRSEGDFFRLALAPFAAAGYKGADLADVETIPPEQLAKTTLSEFDAVVLANVPHLPPAEARAVEQYVYGGGGLLIAPGNLTRIDLYNQYLHRDGSGILPARLHPATAIDGARATGVLGLDLDHPILRFLRGSGDPVPTATIGRYFPAAVHSTRARVLGSYVSGDPFLIESRTGRGRVLLLTTPIDADWSTLPLTSFYLPFAQSLVRYLAGGAIPEHNLRLGQELIMTIDAPLDERTVSLELPDGSRTRPQISLLGRSTEIRSSTTLPGRYHLRYRQEGASGKLQTFVVSSPPEESDLSPLDELRWAALARELGFEIIDPIRQPASATLADARQRRELWPILLGIVLLLGMVEMVLTRWITVAPPQEASPTLADLQPEVQA